MKVKSLLSFLLLLAITLGATAQTKKEAYEAYSSAANGYKKNPKEAITKLYKAIDICKQLGVDGDEIKAASEKIIPNAYFTLAMVEYKKKNLQGTLDNLEKARETADKYNIPTVKKRVEKTIPKLYNVMGNSKYKAEKYDEAISNYQKAVEIKPGYADPYLGMVLSYEKMGNEEKMLELIDKTIEVAEASNNVKMVDKVKLKAKVYFLKKADAAQKAKKYKEVVGLLDGALKYDEHDAEIYRLMAINFNRLEQWKEGAKAATKAIELKKGTADEMAEIYYLLATAYHKMNNIPKACDAYKKAAYGTFKPNADYNIKQLKCK